MVVIKNKDMNEHNFANFTFLCLLLIKNTAQAGIYKAQFGQGCLTNPAVRDHLRKQSGLLNKQSLVWALLKTWNSLGYSTEVESPGLRT